MGLDYVKAMYCHAAYSTSAQSASCEKTGWMKFSLWNCWETEEVTLFTVSVVLPDTHMQGKPVWKMEEAFLVEPSLWSSQVTDCVVQFVFLVSSCYLDLILTCLLRTVCFPFLSSWLSAPPAPPATFFPYGSPSHSVPSLVPWTKDQITQSNLYVPKTHNIIQIADPQGELKT